VQPKTKGFENPLQNQPNPLQKDSKTTKQSRGTIPEWNCALKIKKKKKWEKNLGFWGRLGFGIFGEKWGRKREMGADGGWWWWRKAGGGAVVVGEMMGGDGMVFGGG
jgi:hypothetical protein